MRAYELGWVSYKNQIYRSVDGGQTWTMVSEAPFQYSYDFHFATVHDSLFLIDNSISLRSTDDGLSWQEIVLPEPSTQISSDTATLLLRSYSRRIYISRDGAGTWQQIADSSALFGTVHFLKDSIIVAENYQTDIVHYLISRDFGQTWSNLPKPPVPPMYGVFFYPGQGDTLFSRTDKLYWSTNYGATWQYWGNTWAGLYGIEPSIPMPDGAFGYRNDGVWRYYFATDQWEKRNAGLVNSFVNDLFTNDQVLFAQTSVGLFGTTSAGSPWQELALPPSQSNSYRFDVSGDTLFAATYRTLCTYRYKAAAGWDTLASPVDYGIPNDFHVVGAKIVWVRDGEIYVIDRYSGLIDTIKPPASTDNFNNALRIVDGRYIYMDNSGSAFISDDQGSTWTKTLSQNVPGNNTDNHFFYEPDRLFVCTRDGLHISSDKGLSWSGNIKYSPWSTGALAMTSMGDLLFLTLRGQGVLISPDSGASWQPYNTGLGSLNGRALAHFGDQLFVGTSFNGVWRRAPNLQQFQGTVYADTNNNGLRDPGEAPFPGAIVHASPGNLYAVSQANGAYSLYAGQLSDTFSIAPFSPYITINPPFRLANPGGDLDFGLYAQPGVHDLAVSIVNTKPFKPGFPGSISLSCHNYGTVPETPLLQLQLDPLLQYSFAGPPPDSTDWQQSFFWQLDTLQPFQTRSISVYTYTLPDAMIGDSIHLMAHVGPEMSDQTPANNSAWLHTVVVGAYDPNDKQADPAERISPAQIDAGQPVTYTIRFQNTGNHPAGFVRILDTLSADFDLGSLQILSASHPFSRTLRGAGVLEFYFENIQLPDSSSNPVASNGYVQYSIRPKSGLALNTALQNRAFIYFDFNTPVETNTTSTAVSALTTVHATPAPAPLVIVPNPASGQLTITRNTGNAARLQVQDAGGRVILYLTVNDRELQLNTGRFPEGLYTVSISNAGETEWGRFVIQH